MAHERGQAWKTREATTSVMGSLPTYSRLHCAHERKPVISGDRIVYLDSRTGNEDIFMLEFFVGEDDQGGDENGEDEQN